MSPRSARSYCSLVTYPPLDRDRRLMDGGRLVDKATTEGERAASPGRDHRHPPADRDPQSPKRDPHTIISESILSSIHFITEAKKKRTDHTVNAMTMCSRSGETVSPELVNAICASVDHLRSISINPTERRRRSIVIILRISICSSHYSSTPPQIPQSLSITDRHQIISSLRLK